MKCVLCPELIKSRRKICEGEIYSASIDEPQVMVVAEAPGFEEDRQGRPLIGTSGQEARHHLTINGIAGKGVILDNITRCHPRGNRDPNAAEIANCTEANLIPSILTNQPKWVITMGRISTRFFLGDVDMEMVHGIPHTIDFFGLPLIIIPTYHPAAGLHTPEKMILFQADMRIAGAVIRGTMRPSPPVDLYEGKEEYVLIESAQQCTDALTHTPHHDPGKEKRTIAVDTEWAEGGPWGVSFSVAPGEAFVIQSDQRPSLAVLSRSLSYGSTTTIIQNALYDLPVLAQMGIRPGRVADTMVMAYLLQTEPQGLKQLAYRHCGMKMSSYGEMVASATRAKAIAYLERVMGMEWPDPDPVLEWKKGEPHVRQPQNIKRKVNRVLSSIGEGEDINPFDRWRKMSDDQVERMLGVLTEADLSDIEVGKAVTYSARDADATLRVYPILWERVVQMGLEDTFWRDMRAMPMVVDMMANGMPVDLDAFASLSDYFQSRMDLIQRKMQITVGHHLPGKAINPASYPQMSTLIYDSLRLQDEGGKHRSKKGAAKRSTADDILKRYVRLHPAVQDIIDWREYQKLKTSYADAIPKLVSPDGRIRTTLRMTRVATGRLSSSSPNLMAQPVRTEEGRKVRDCYVAGPGKVLMSGDYCLDPATKILTHDYKWTSINKINKGDLLWGVDETASPRHRRRCRLSIAESIKEITADKYEIEMSDGTKLVCTREHPWLARRRSTHNNRAYHWVRTDRLRIGWDIWKAFDVWKSRPDWESGYLAGLFDADGSLSFGRGVILTFIQNEGSLMDNTFVRLISRGYDFHIPWSAGKGKAGFPGSKGIVQHIWISNRRDIARFLGEMRPQRLINKAWPMMEDRTPPCGSAYVRSIKPVGGGKVIALQTNSKTFMAEGFITHNSQVEMRVAANDSKDERMMRIFWRGLDIHRQTASDMFGVPAGQVDEMKHRYPAKRVGFGILNLITAEGLQRELTVGGAGEWTLSDCKGMIKAWFDIYHGVAAYMKASGEQAKRHGYVRDMWGRLRYIPGIRSTNRWMRIEAERQAGNAPIQMGAQGIIKEAMGRLVPVYRLYGVDPLIQVHDDIVWELEEWMPLLVQPEIRGIMEGVAPKDFIIPLRIDFKVGKRWGSLSLLS